MHSGIKTKTPSVSQGKLEEYVAAQLAGGVTYKGGYNADTNTPDLDTSPSGILKGEMYTVTAAGTFFTALLEVEDVLISEKDDPTLEADWTIINKNIDSENIIYNSTFTAIDEIIVGTGNETHSQVTLGASEILGKKATGNVDNLSASEVRTILNVEDGATASNTDAGTADNDSLFWNDTLGVYEAKTPEEARAILDVPVVAKINPLALSQGVTLTAASSGSNGIQVANNDDINFGTGDFTLCWIGSLPDWTPDANVKIFNTGAASPFLEAFVHTSGSIRLRLNNIIFSSVNLNMLLADALATIVFSISVEDIETVINFYINGILFDTISDTNVGSTDNSEPLYICGASAVRFASTTQAAYTYNYALDADQVKDLYENGVALSDRDGSMTELGNGAWQNGYSPASWENFTSANYDNFVASNSLADDEIRIIIPIDMLKIGKKYQIVFIPTNIKDVTLDYIHQSTSAYVGEGEISRNINISSAVKQSLIFTATYAATHIMFIMSPLAGGEFSISDFSIIQLGTTLRLEPENIQLSPGQWLDAAHSNHAKLPAKGATLTRPQSDGIINWVNTWAASSAGQYIGGINENIFPADNIRIEWISYQATATGVNITMGDQTDTDRYVESVALEDELDVSSPAHRNHDGTNLKLVITPSGTFTGSITTTIKYKLIG
ncbi:MAG: hypothetical protein J7M10_07820 [Candidatus Cloacimonetes bacterium]|nr:hypothetical protein [Candidatus Cloacimonadota bacterium]